jgi:hypothetical protein
MDPAALELDGQLDLDLPARGAEHGGDVLAQPEPIGGEPEPVADDVVVGELGAPRRPALLGPARRLVRMPVTVGLGMRAALVPSRRSLRSPRSASVA